jgi:hypothetical protein
LVITENWGVENFTLGKKEYGDLEDFRKNFSERLVPNFKLWKEKTLNDDISQIMYNFSVFLSSPTKEGLDHINQMIFNRLGKDSTETKSLGNKIFRFYHHNILKHLVWIVLIISFSVVLYSVRAFYFNVLPDEAFTFSVEIGVLLVVGYFAIPAVIKKRST